MICSARNLAELVAKIVRQVVNIRRWWNFTTTTENRAHHFRHFFHFRALVDLWVQLSDWNYCGGGG